MMIFEQVSNQELERSARCAAGIECCLAIWAARAPEPEPMRRAARDIEASLDLQLRKSIRDLDRSLAGWPLHALNWFYRDGTDDFERTVSLLADTPPRQLAFELALGSIPPSDVAQLQNADDPLKEALSAGYIPDAALKSMRPLLNRPEETVTTVLRVIEAFWSESFERIWAKERETLQKRCGELDSQIKADLAGTLVGISPRGFLDLSEDRLTFAGGHNATAINCNALESLDVIPSLWLRRRVVLAHGLNRVAICVSAGQSRNERLPSDWLPQMFSVLGDRRRFEILRLCMERPRSTKELALHLKITEGPVSRHLKELESHQLLIGQRHGRQVNYAVVPEMLALLGRQLESLPQQTLERAEQAQIPVTVAAATK